MKSQCLNVVKLNISPYIGSNVLFPGSRPPCNASGIQALFISQSICQLILESSNPQRRGRKCMEEYSGSVGSQFLPHFHWLELNHVTPVNWRGHWEISLAVCPRGGRNGFDNQIALSLSFKSVCLCPICLYSRHVGISLSFQA